MGGGGGSGTKSLNMHPSHVLHLLECTTTTMTGSYMCSVCIKGVRGSKMRVGHFMEGVIHTDRQE